MNETSYYDSYGNLSDTENFTYEKALEAFTHNRFLVIGIYFVVFMVAVIANVLLIIVVIRDRYMQNVTNYFLVNLSVADLLVALICMPSSAWKAYTDVYSFGSFSCKISAYLQGISVASSIFTITAMAVDRYLAIIQPFGLRKRLLNKLTTVIVILALWTTSLILFSPNLWIADLVPVSISIPSYPDDINVTLTMCRMIWPNFPVSQNIIGIIWFTFMFAFPGFIMTVAYVMMGKTLCSALPLFENNEAICPQRNRVMRTRKRVACILLLLAVVFAGCWLPYHILNLIEDTTTMFSLSKDNFDQINAYLLLLGHANSALNPVIYCALSKNFRHSIKNLLKIKISFRRNATRLNNCAADSSGSGFPFAKKPVPLLSHPTNGFGITRRQSSQKTTRTCAV